MKLKDCPIELGDRVELDAKYRFFKFEEKGGIVTHISLWPSPQYTIRFFNRWSSNVQNSYARDMIHRVRHKI